MQTHAVADEDVLLGGRLVHVLETDAVPARAPVVREQVATEDEALGVHEERPHRVVAELIVLDHVVVAVHEVQTVAAAR